MSISVSCVIPTHERAHFLVEALASVEAQTITPMEIIVVSDVEDDETVAVCAEFSKRSSIPLSLEYASGSGGASSSRNRGAGLASGDVLAFLDDDDTWSPDFLRRSLAGLDQPGADISVAWMNMFMDDKVKAGPAIPPGLIAEDVVAINPGVTGSNMLVRREAFREIGGFDSQLRMKNDTDFFFRYLKTGRRYTVVEERLVNQRKHDSGQLTGHSLARADHTEAYLQKHRHDLKRADRKHMKFVIHRIRSHASSKRSQRLLHKIWAMFNYTYKQFDSDRRNRRDREFFEVPSIDAERPEVTG